jgi:hypothetical protein
MKEFKNINLNSKKIQEYMSYFENYYGSDFRPGQGLDEITDMISHYSISGTWIDLGGGTSTFIWLPAFKELVEVHSVDKNIESAYVQNLNRSTNLSGCYNHIVNRYGKNVDELNKIQINYSQMDLFGEFIVDKKYSNVSQFGLLGLCQTKYEYLRHLDKLVKFMDFESVFMGANWVFSSIYSKKRGFDNSYLNTKLIEEYALQNKRALLYSRLISILDDPYYNAVLIYAFSI